MAKKGGRAGDSFGGDPVPSELQGQPDDFELTNMRIYKRNNRKLKQLAALRGEKSLHALLDALINDMLDHELLEAMARRSAELRPRNGP
jgi:hypothetical protein